MAKLKFVKGLPDKGTGRTLSSNWDDILSQLQTRPGEWALIGTFDTHQKAGTCRSTLGPVARRRGIPLRMAQRTVNGKTNLYAMWEAVESNGSLS